MVSKFIQSDLGTRARGDMLEVTLTNGANVRLLDSVNFEKYRRGQAHRYVGGLARRSPVRIQVPSTGHWHAVVDMQGLRGSTRAGFRVIGAGAQRPLPPLGDGPVTPMPPGHPTEAETSGPPVEAGQDPLTSFEDGESADLASNGKPIGLVMRNGLVVTPADLTRVHDLGAAVDSPERRLVASGVESLLSDAEGVIEGSDLPQELVAEIESLRSGLSSEWRNPSPDVPTLERYVSRLSRALATASVEVVSHDPIDPDGELAGILRRAIEDQRTGEIEDESDRAAVLDLLANFRDLFDRVDDQFEALEQRSADNRDEAAEIHRQVAAMDERLRSTPGAPTQVMIGLASSAAWWWLAQTGGPGTMAAALLRVLIGIHQITGF